MLNPEVDHGKLTAVISCYMVKMYASPHHLAFGGVEIQLHLSFSPNENINH